MKINHLILVLLVAFGPSAFSQSLLKKAKDKVNQSSKILRDIKGNGSNGAGSSDNSEVNNDGENADDYSGNNRSGRPSNTKGKKLSSTSIDVSKEITNAETNLNNKDYAQTRSNIQQAILGIEVAMAYKILESLPDEVDGLKADENTDNVAASGSGYTGLTVEREYFTESQENSDSDDYYDEEEGEKYLKFSLVNSSLYTSSITTYISNPMYTSSDDGDKKIIQYKGVNSLLEYDEYEGYTLSVPIGNETLVQFSCVNFEDENQVIKTADAFDIEKMRNYLGEK